MDRRNGLLNSNTIIRLQMFGSDFNAYDAQSIPMYAEFIILVKGI